MEVDFNVKNIVQVMLYSSPGIDMCVYGVGRGTAGHRFFHITLQALPLPRHCETDRTDLLWPIGLLVQPQLLFSSLTFTASLVLSSYPDNITESFTRADLAFLPCGRPRPRLRPHRVHPRSLSAHVPQADSECLLETPLKTAFEEVSFPETPL